MYIIYLIVRHFIRHFTTASSRQNVEGKLCTQSSLYIAKCARLYIVTETYVYIPIYVCM